MTIGTQHKGGHVAAVIRSDEEALEIARALAAEFAREAAQRDAESRAPHEELARFSQSGLWGITVPREYGGAGVASTTLTEVVALISAADGSLGQIPQNHYYTVEAIRVQASDAQKQHLFARVLAGERFGNALSERRTRTASERAMHLAPHGDGTFRVSGEKFYATGALYAQSIPTALTGEDGRAYLAIIPRDAPGVQVIDDWSGFGQRGTASGTVKFDQVSVTADQVILLADPNDPRTTIKPYGQLIHAAIDLGLARGALDTTQTFVATQSRPWIEANVDRAADDPLTINEFGRLAVRLEAADALLERAAWRVDAARVDPQPGKVGEAAIAVAEARALTTEIALAASTKLIELGGTRAAMGELNLDRYWRNARVHTLHDPVRWKIAAVGDYYLNDRLPAQSGTT
ncbi:SfnB family sulfur acquisition oxidoreductase [Paraburkholderia sp. BCC1886]|uniref:SfnB family sulfur acquisition oxidoreductase n=1 Tax=Paraburkholderia sp. BCC1886 TaxID=2562670 RepID=UPI001182444B|nr:SfnB family sulfur acquisition oxidoreductase [Paraburkholderia sp. BCC1886]